MVHKKSSSQADHDKIYRLTRIRADLAEAENIAPEHIAEAISYQESVRKL